MENFEDIVLVSVSQSSLSGKKMLWEYMNAHPNILFIATGDMFQCNAVDTGS
jgi:hypothetical protein